MLSTIQRLDGKLVAAILAASIAVGIVFGPRVAVATCPKLKMTEAGRVVPQYQR